MNLKTYVKVGNISNLSDARYCAGYGVNMLGFNFDPAQPDAISTETALEIMGWVEVENFVLECGHLEINKVLKLAELFEGAIVQIDDLDAVKTLVDQHHSVILRLSVENREDLEKVKAQIEDLPLGIKYLLLESDNPELHTELNELATTLSCPVLKGFDNQADNIAQLVEETVFAGIALKGSAEEKPGYKEYDELAEILEILEEDD